MVNFIVGLSMILLAGIPLIAACIYIWYFKKKLKEAKREINSLKKILVLTYDAPVNRIVIGNRELTEKSILSLDPDASLEPYAGTRHALVVKTKLSTELISRFYGVSKVFNPDQVIAKVEF